MKTVAITGHLNGIGKATNDLLIANGYTVKGFDIEHDINDPEQRFSILEQSRDCDIFINNAVGKKDSQNIMFELFFNEWKRDKSKHILSVGSLMKYFSSRVDVIYRNVLLHPPDYVATKKKLNNQTIVASSQPDTECQLGIIQPGFVYTEFISSIIDEKNDLPTLTADNVADKILYMIEAEEEIVELTYRVRGSFKQYRDDK